LETTSANSFVGWLSRCRVNQFFIIHLHVLLR
jgi:hypothetical protein